MGVATGRRQLQTIEEGLVFEQRDIELPVDLIDDVAAARVARRAVIVERTSQGSGGRAIVDEVGTMFITCLLYTSRCV